MLDGVGEKVADCILLFAFEKMEAFPVDTHVEKVIRTYYGDQEFFKGGMTKTKIVCGAGCTLGSTVVMHSNTCSTRKDLKA